MPGRRHLLDPLPEHATPPDNVKNLRLVTVDFDRARPKVVGRPVQIYKLSSHVFSSIDFSCRLEFDCLIRSIQMKKARPNRARRLLEAEARSPLAEALFDN